MRRYPPPTTPLPYSFAAKYAKRPIASCRCCCSSCASCAGYLRLTRLNNKLRLEDHTVRSCIPTHPPILMAHTHTPPDHPIMTWPDEKFVFQWIDFHQHHTGVSRQEELVGAPERPEKSNTRFTFAAVRVAFRRNRFAHTGVCKHDASTRTHRHARIIQKGCEESLITLGRPSST